MKTTIINALKETRGIRVTYGNRWLIWDEKMDWGSGKAKGAWVVYGRERGQRKTRTIVTTRVDEMAVTYLLYQEV